MAVFQIFHCSFDIILTHLSYTTLSLFICDSLVAQDSQRHGSRFVTVGMNSRLLVGLLRDSLQRIFLASDSNILDAWFAWLTLLLKQVL